MAGLRNGNRMMNGYYRPQEVLVMEAELARAKAMLATEGLAPDLLEVNTPLLAELVIKARSQPRREGDVASLAASQFKRMMIGLDTASGVHALSGSDLLSDSPDRDRRDGAERRARRPN